MITMIKLRNFKCLDNTQIRCTPLTLLTGLNGMGKSSVLQALLLLRQSFHLGLLPKTGLALNGDLVHIGTAKDALYESAEEEQIEFTIKWNKNRTGRWFFRYNRDADVLDLISPIVRNDFYKQSLFEDNFQYLKAERIGPRPYFEMSDYMVRRRRQLGTRGEYTAHFLSVFGHETISCGALKKEEAKSSQIHHQVEAWLSEISPGTRLEYTQHNAMDVVTLQYSFIYGDQVSNLYRSTNVGFGITYTVPILVAILSSFEGSLLLFENPEAHLHPKAQSKIGELIALSASCGVQILLETHSDHILNGIRVAVRNGKLKPEDVSLNFFMRIDDGQRSRIEIISPLMDDNGRIDRWPEGFFDEWDNSLEALLSPVRR